MEYHMKYRDIPWGVALTVLPGKIIGSLIIKPAKKFENNWKSILLLWIKCFAFILVLIIVSVAIVILVDLLVNDGTYYTILSETLNSPVLEPKNAMGNYE